MKCKGHRLGLIVTRIKGTTIVMVTVENFPLEEVGEVTHQGVVGIIEYIYDTRTKTAARLGYLVKSYYCLH